MKNLYKIFTSSAGATTDTRNIPSGSVFFALKGPNFDGNAFAREAIEKGAMLAVVDDPAVVDQRAEGKYFLVEDVLHSLQRLAAIHREELGIPILAITGTNGKTTTKELAARVMSLKYKTSYTQGNLNNHIGVPLTILSMTSATEFGIVEIGASARGEISDLCRIASPDYGIVTNIGKAHLEGFGGLEGVMKGKGELLDYLVSHDGTAFYCEDEPLLEKMIAQRSGIKAIGYSARDAESISNPLEGDYNLKNIAAALAVGHFFGVDSAEMRNAIEAYVPDNHRSQRTITGSNDLIIDCYNANPSSMEAAIRNFCAEKSEKEKILILGEMLELGDYSESEHRNVMKILRECGLGDAILVGTNFSPFRSEQGVKFFDNTESLRNYLAQNPLHGKFILIKGSHGTRLDKVIDRL